MYFLADLAVWDRDVTGQLFSQPVPVPVVNVPTGPDRPVYRQEITIHLVQEKELETGLTVCK